MQPAERELCSKCEAPMRAGADACAACGLARSRMAGFTAERDTSATEALRTAWEHTLEDWSADARHEAVFQLAAGRGEYSWVAARYREQARTREGDPMIAKQMDRIRRAIEATLLVSATARDKPEATPYKSLMTMLVLMLILLGIGAFYIFMKSRTTPTDSAPPARSVAPMSPRPQVR